MINIIKLNSSEPYKIFQNHYNKALQKNQAGIEAISVSSYCISNNEVDSRYVNLKYINNDQWTFFTNYNSPKATQFKNSNKIAALIYWESINVQIRIKAHIKKTDSKLSDSHFSSREYEKNILAIASEQSKVMNSYDFILEKVKKVSNKNKIIKTRPLYWGGFSFKPYYFEFWEGNKSRINKREQFKIIEGKWHKSYLEP